MKISNILIALTIILLASCDGNQSNDHSHDHGTEEHGHDHGEGEHHENHVQEEFTLPADSVQVDEPTLHKHDDGGEDHNH